MKANHPWVMKWMEVRRQRDLGITDDDIRLMRKDAEPEEDEDRTDAEPEEDEDRKKEAKADDDQDDADAAEERDRMNDLLILRGYSVRRRFDVVGDAGPRRVALHEAGHCVVAIAQGRRINFATVVPGDDYTGKMSEDETPEMMTKLLDLLSGGRADAEAEACARKHVVGYMAGTVAEWLMCPRESWQSNRHHTAGSDLKFARLFATAIAGDGSEAVLSAAREEARDLLEANRQLVEAIADALMARGTMTGGEIEIILKEHER
jgi:hypothetical protein